ncbi:MAG TPA: PAS domain-containing protein, partial [Methanomassiliicoccales archaeon]|nr:PAS domain-containing protein [Methanomassiliicoccales archaeon]
RAERPPQTAEIKKRSAELSHAQHYTSGLLGSIKDPQLTVSEDGSITDLNEAMESICQRSRDELVDSKLQAIFVNPKGLEQTMKSCFAQGKVAGSPHRLVLPSGEPVSVLLNAITYRDRSDGLVHGALLSIQTISNSIFNDMMQSQRYARSLLEASLDALVFLDLDGTILDVNDASVRITGRDRENMIGSNFSDYFTDSKKAREGIRETLHRGSVRNFELTLVDRSLQEVPVQFNATAYRDHDGALKGVFAAARDVRELKAMIAELQATKDYSRGLIESSLDMMVTVDRENMIMDVNEAATRLTGKPREELIGASFLDLFNDRERAALGVNTCFTAGSVRNFELDVNSGKEIIPVSFNASVYRDRTGTVKGVFGIARDIRERMRMVQEIEEARIYARGLIESSPDMMLTIDRAGRITDVNEEAVRLMARPRAEIVGSSFSSYFLDRIRAEEGVESAFTTGSVRDYRLDLRAGGRVEPVSFNASLYTDSDGKNTRVFAIARKVQATL